MQMHQLVDNGKFHVASDLVLRQFIIRRVQYLDGGGSMRNRPVDVAQGALLQIPDPDDLHVDFPVLEVQALLPEMKPVLSLLLADNRRTRGETVTGGETGVPETHKN